MDGVTSSLERTLSSLKEIENSVKRDQIDNSKVMASKMYVVRRAVFDHFGRHI